MVEGYSVYCFFTYASIARRISSETGAPVFTDRALRDFNCASFKNKAVRFMVVKLAYSGIHRQKGVYDNAPIAGKRLPYPPDSLWALRRMF